jgi:chemotaxis protein methyltransferase CheR
MTDSDCVTFLQWALPQLELRWEGFRRVRGQVCKRLGRRMSRLGLDGFAAYRARLATDPQEWRALDACCHITISRFFRDRGVFEILRTRVLPDIAARAVREGREARAWSAGCASGEEPYTCKILWDLEMDAAGLSVVATDIDESVLERARAACYEPSSLRELPEKLVTKGFERMGRRLCVRPRHREGVTIVRQDLRLDAPAGPFDLVLCRNLAFTYFTLPLQRQVLARIKERLAPRGYLVIGAHERLP